MDTLAKIQMEIAIEALKNMMPEYIMGVEVIAKQMKVYEEALIKAGFSNEQAFEIVKEHGTNVGKMMSGGN